MIDCNTLASGTINMSSAEKCITQMGTITTGTDYTIATALLMFLAIIVPVALFIAISKTKVRK